MFKQLIKKYNINLYGMIKNGTVALITMIGVYILFGMKNIMIAFPIALTSTVLGRQNFYVKTFYKVIWILVIDILIVVMSFISSLNLYSGILINFISIFLIMYVIISQYDLTFYKPFIMLYVFTQYSTVAINELPERIYSVIFGISTITILSFIKRVNEKSVLGNSFIAYIKLLKSQVGNIISDTFSNEVMNNGTKLMRELTYKVYITRHKKYLTTNLGIIQFKLFINLEYFNLILKDIYSEKKVGIRELNIINDILGKFCKYAEGKITISVLENNVIFFVNNNKHKSKIVSQICNIVLELYENMQKIAIIKKREVNKVYIEWQRSELDMFKTTFTEYFRGDSIRFKFAMRMAITLTLALLVGEFLGLYKIIWAIITIMSIMQPYYEDTITKARDRIKGNILAILITAVVINICNNKILTIGVLIASLYLLYGFKEYYKISLFAAIASICVSSLTENINVLIVYRVIYVVVGVVFVLIANKVIFPYKLKDGINQLINKIKKYNQYLIKNMKTYRDNTKEEHEIRDIVIHVSLLMQKLYLRNMQYGSKEINDFIDKNNEFLIKASYIVLFENNKNSEELSEILKLYNEFSNYEDEF